MHVVVLDTQKRQLLEHNTDLTKQFHPNPAAVMVSDRTVVSVGMQTPWYALYPRFAPQSMGSMKPPLMGTKKRFQRGVTPSLELFHDPELLDDIYVLQAHTSLLQELYQVLLLDK